MGLSNALRRMLETLAPGGVLAVALLAMAAPAQAGPLDGCLLRTNSETAIAQNDDVNVSVTGPQTGNFWARRDTFTFDYESDCYSAYISGVSVLVKTPFEITPEPDIDDIDTGADVSALADALEALFPEFDHYGANAFGEPGGASPTDFASFHGVSICLFVGTTGTIAGCLSDGPVVLADLDGGSMRFGLALGGDSFYLGDDGECDSECLTEFELVTIVYSTAFGERAGNDIPEAVIGWQFVPEPSLLTLLAPALGAWAVRRRWTRA